MAVKGQLSGYWVSCENCGKLVYKTKTNYNRHKHHYCSNKCQLEKQHELKYEDRLCEICGSVFHTTKKSAQRFCSIGCQNKWQSNQTGILNSRSTKVEIKCEYCGKIYYQKLYKTKNSQHNFCSNECRQAWYSEIFSQDKNWKEESRKRAIQILEDKKLGTDTKLQIMVNDILDKMHIPYINEQGFEYYAVDNYLNKNNLIIEVMGDFWHCHPLKYLSPNNYEIHKKRIPRDKAKHTYIKNNYGIEILYLWEDDIYNNLDVCKSLITEYIDNNGILKNYHSFNYHLEDGKLAINNDLIIPYQDMTNA